MTAVKVRVYRARPGSLRHFLAPLKWVAHKMGDDIDDNEFRHFDTWADAIHCATGGGLTPAPTRKPYVKVTDEMRAQMGQMVADGRNVREIAAELGVTGGGLTPAPTRKPYVKVTDEMRAQMGQMVADGRNVREIAAELGVTGQSVRNHLLKAVSS